jgi:pilus assembly protein CpaB
MHNVSRIAAIALVVLATVLALVAFGLGKQRQDTPAAVATTPLPAPAPAPPAKTAHAFVAAQALPAGQVIQASSLRDVPVAAAPEGSFVQLEALIGQVPRVDIPEGSIVTASLLANPIAMQLRPGERALAVPVDEVSGVGYRVQPGDYVDVVLTLKMEDPEATTMGRQHTDSRVLAARLRVLAYGARDLPKVGVAEASGKSDTPEPPARMAVLAVPLAQIDPLVLGLQAGRLSLALRHPGDESMPSDLLFPQPPSLLAPRGDLTAEQRTWLLTPENRAYAGIRDASLIGHAKANTSRAPSRTPMQGGLEIIRGSTASSSHAPQTVSP